MPVGCTRRGHSKDGGYYDHRKTYPTPAGLHTVGSRMQLSIGSICDYIIKCIYIYNNTFISLSGSRVVSVNMPHPIKERARWMDMVDISVINSLRTWGR
jgi:hypothetical protein